MTRQDGTEGKVEKRRQWKRKTSFDSLSSAIEQVLEKFMSCATPDEPFLCTSQPKVVFVELGWLLCEEESRNQIFASAPTNTCLTFVVKERLSLWLNLFAINHQLFQHPYPNRRSLWLLLVCWDFKLLIWFSGFHFASFRVQVSVWLRVKLNFIVQEFVINVIRSSQYLNRLQIGFDFYWCWGVLWAPLRVDCRPASRRTLGIFFWSSLMRVTRS